MTSRLLEELEEMSGTCSTGFASRLANVISGFGKFNIRISWEQQIVSNFFGRLNALARKINHKNSVYYAEKSLARKINHKNSVYYAEKSLDVVELWLNDNMKDKNRVIKSLTKSDKLTDTPPMKNIIEKYLKSNKKKKIEKCVEDFSFNVLNEMTLSSSDFSNRQNFLLFFRTSMLPIREEMYEEFKDLISDSDYDLYFRKALESYEGY